MKFRRADDASIRPRRPLAIRDQAAVWIAEMEFSGGAFQTLPSPDHQSVDAVASCSGGCDGTEDAALLKRMM